MDVACEWSLRGLRCDGRDDVERGRPEVVVVGGEVGASVGQGGCRRGDGASGTVV